MFHRKLKQNKNISRLKIFTKLRTLSLIKILLVIVKKGTYKFDYEILKIAYQGVRNVRFSENLACFVFLKHPF